VVAVEALFEVTYTLVDDPEATLSVDCSSTSPPEPMSDVTVSLTDAQRSSNGGRDSPSPGRAVVMRVLLDRMASLTAIKVNTMPSIGSVRVGETEATGSGTHRLRGPRLPGG